MLSGDVYNVYYQKLDDEMESFVDYIVGLLREYPTLALFLTVGAGFFFGKLKIGRFSIGSVTAVLIIGVLIGQLDIPMSGPIKMFFFMMFLFSIGYKVGPDFFKSLRGQGAKQALFAVTLSSIIFATTLTVAWIMGYDKGETVGLFGGSQTCSALIGVGGEAISKLGISDVAKKSITDSIPVCYAVTYIFGTLGTVVVLGNFGPRLLGGLDKVKAAAADMELSLNDSGSKSDPALINAGRGEAYRCFRVGGDLFESGQTVRSLEAYLREMGMSVYVDRLRHDGEISVPRYDDVIQTGDEVVVCGHNDCVVGAADFIGEEIPSSDLLSYPLERVGIVAVKKGFLGRPLSEIRRLRWMRGLVVRDASRDGRQLDIDGDTEFCRGDRLTVVGRPGLVQKAAKHIGHIDRPSDASDLMFVGLAIFIGGLFGAMSFYIGSIPVSFGTSGGALVAGLVFGWMRSKHPTYGHIPDGALWFMNNLGLNVFIAVVGIEAAPSFVSGLKSVGPMLFVAGAVATVVPLLIGLWLGQKVFKFNPAITLGCVAGTRTCTASLGAVQDALGSSLPAIGYTVTYAVSNILLVIWGLVAVLLI